MGRRWVEQLKAIGLTLVLAIVGTAVIAMIVKAVLGLRPDAGRVRKQASTGPTMGRPAITTRRAAAERLFPLKEDGLR